ncbi:MAG TPA: sulfatase/phosphatase domain-containing protein, partial [Myxococcota bacterium]|nr:sulfatase/phosphatase domain-containing protein [Myxococcota bacterium]
ALVGELLSELERRGILAQTLVVFVADNGWDQGPHAPAGQANLDGPRGKRTLHDLGFRAPIVLRWPGGVPSGVVRDELVSAVDLFPTLLDYAGVAIPPDLPGTSLRPLLEGHAKWGRKSLVEGMTDLRGGKGLAPSQPRKDTGFFVRRGRWRYLWYEGGGQELYDVVADPREERDVARERPRLARKLRREIRGFRERIGLSAASAPSPQPRQ